MAAAPRPPRPNVVLVVTDQQRYDTIRWLGNGLIRTPNLDRLCAEGMAFERAYCTNPLCSPSRASLLTGLLPSQHGCWNVGVPLSPAVPTLPTLLAAQGYRTAAVGKLHLEPCLAPGSPEAPPRIYDWEHFRRWHGPYHGFADCHLAIGHTREPHAAGMHYGLWLREQGVDVSAHFGGPPSHVPAPAGADEGAWSLPAEFHNSRWAVDTALDALERLADGGRPFLLWLGLQDPHMPFVAPQPWFDGYRDAPLPLPVVDPADLASKPALYQAAYEGRLPALGLGDAFGIPGVAEMDHRTITPALARARIAAYYAMIGLLDHHLGRLLDALDSLGQTERTLLVFTSDHGELLGHHGLWGKGPFHTEDILRVPLVARWPGVIPAGRRSGALQSLADLVPTLLRAAGAETPPGLAGCDQWPVWSGRVDAARRAALVENRVSDRLYLKTLVTERHKLTIHLRGDGGRSAGDGEFYDLVADPGERVNRWTRGPDDEAGALLWALLADQCGLEPPPPPRLAYA